MSRCSNEFRLIAPSRSLDRTQPGARALVLAIFLACACSAPALAEEEIDASQRLAGAISRLVPYSFEGTTLAALGELDRLTNESDARVAATAGFIRTAAEVDLLAYATLSDRAEVREQLASALGTTPDELVEVVEGHVDQAAQGSFAPQIATSAHVLTCLASDDWQRCGPLLRRVADGGGAGATAARLFLLRAVIASIERARTGSAEDGINALLEQSHPLCAAPGRAEVARLCRSARAQDAARMQLAEQVFQHAVEDLAALQRAGQGDDPMVLLASGWVTSTRERMGWLAFVQPAGAGTFSGLDLPDATSAASALPLEILVVSSEEVSVALVPTTIIHTAGSQRLGGQGEYTLPGKNVLSAPFGFRPVIRPVKQVTDALQELRAQLEQSIASLSGPGPSWLDSEQRVLGLVVDRNTTLVDLGRFVASAKLAGYRRFALIGRRSDGELAALHVTAGTLEAGPTPANMPRLRVGPTDVDFSSDGPPQSFPRREPERLGPAVVRALNGSGQGFAIQGRPMMPYGIVFPSIDAVIAAAPTTPPGCLFLLPP